ncbi:MAG: bamB [Gammaproteobacteria bacterium]|jgi:outer membrane protein assembly factor BamB|nr:bamB [Gammaproteobacteria bacterium]
MKKILIGFLPLMLGACSIFSPYGTSNIPSPAPLQKITPQVAPKLVWSTSVGSGSNGAYLQLAPAISNNVVYTIDQNGLFTATTADGKKLYDTRFKDGGKSNLAADGNMVAFVDTRAVLHVISSDHAKSLWQATLTDQTLAAPTFTPSLVLTKAMDGTVTAFDRATGQQRWQYQHAVPALMLRASSAPLVNGNVAYVGFSDGKVVALSLTDGDEIWSTQAADPQGFSDIERMVDIDANLILQDGRLFVATYQGQVDALAPATGNILWQAPNSVYADIAVDNQLVYAVHADGTMTAYNQNTGKVVWTQKDFAWRFLTGPTLYQNMLVVGDLEGYVHFIKPATGELLGRIQASKKPTPMIVPPLLMNQSLIVLDTQGNLAAITA